MPVTAAEREFILAQLGVQAKEDVSRLWDAAGRFSDSEFFDYVAQAFPDMVDKYHQTAAQIAATLFEEDFPNTTPAGVVAPIPAAQLTKSAEWALGATGDKALERMSGTMQRAIYDGDRETTAINAQLSGMRWVRVAKADSCAFCRLLASRSATSDDLYRSHGVVQNPDGTYRLVVVGRSVSLTLSDRRSVASGNMSREYALNRRDEMSKVYQRGRRKGQERTRQLRGTQKYGDKYHDFCRCTAKAIPTGINPMDYLSEVEPEFADLAAQWRNEYVKAAEAAESGEPKKILAAWREFDSAIK